MLKLTKMVVELQTCEKISLGDKDGKEIEKLERAVHYEKHKHMSCHVYYFLYHHLYYFVFWVTKKFAIKKKKQLTFLNHMETLPTKLSCWHFLQFVSRTATQAPNTYHEQRAWNIALDSLCVLQMWSCTAFPRKEFWYHGLIPVFHHILSLSGKVKVDRKVKQ